MMLTLRMIKMIWKFCVDEDAEEKIHMVYDVF